MAKRIFKKELEDNEIGAIIDQETGEVKIDGRQTNRPNTGYRRERLNYKSFGILNVEASKVISDRFTHIEKSIIMRMISMARIANNSLSPLNDETSERELSETFGCSRPAVRKALDNLFSWGVYLQISVSEYGDENEYWVLNPYIMWRGKVKDDSIFSHFENTDLTRLVKK